MNKIYLIILLFVMLVTIIILFIRSNKKLKDLETVKEKYKDLIDLEAEKKRIVEETTKEKNEIIFDTKKEKDRILTEKRKLLIDSIEEREGVLREINSNKNISLSIKDELKKLEKKKIKLKEEIRALEEENDMQEFGFYKRKYNFPDSKGYKSKLDSIVKKQKEMIKNKTAAKCGTEWEVGGSKSKGRAMTNDNLKIMLRAFNGECDGAIAKVRYNNVDTMDRRIEKSFDAINKLNKRNDCWITHRFYDLKIEELFLNHEYYEKVQEEKEEQREIKEQMREEERAQREFDRAIMEANKEEERARKSLEKAREQLEKAHGEKYDKLKIKMEELERKLKEAEDNNKRATSMAQLTRSGYVYVISNIGSFGEKVYKIGMTRRLEPLDRVKELSSASVPFKFDVHAMIYTEDAPGLEKNLHNKFNEKRMNRINNRKEFFRVSIDEVEEAVKNLHGDFRLTKLAEARDYRETVAIENKKEVS